MVISPGKSPYRHFLSRPIKRLIPQNGSPMHNPPLWQVIGIGVMLSDTVIPNSDIVGLPAPANLKLRFGDMGEQKRQ